MCFVKDNFNEFIASFFLVAKQLTKAYRMYAFSLDLVYRVSNVIASINEHSTSRADGIQNTFEFYQNNFKQLWITSNDKMVLIELQFSESQMNCVIVSACRCHLHRKTYTMKH